jgi:hypothetical protein
MSFLSNLGTSQLNGVLGVNPTAATTSTAPTPNLQQQALSGAVNFGGLAGVNHLMNPAGLTAAM